MKEYICIEYEERFGSSIGHSYEKVEELIRCKDCIYWKDKIFCTYLEDYQRDPRYYCGSAMRRITKRSDENDRET